MVFLLPVSIESSIDCSHVLSDCQSIENGFNCTSLCESVWFKIWNVSSAGSMGQTCDKAFVHKYANVM